MVKMQWAKKIIQRIHHDIRVVLFIGFITLCGWGNYASAQSNLMDISPQSFPKSVVNTAYTATMTAFGGVAPYKFTTSGLPPGLSLSATGTISGTPIVAGRYSFSVTATDSTGATTTRSYTIVIYSPIKIEINSMPTTGIKGQPYNASFTVTGGSGWYTYVYKGITPPGLSPTVAGIVGTPTTLGTYSFSLTVNDAEGHVSPTINFSISIVDSVAMSGILPVVLTSAIVNNNYTQQLSVIGGVAPYKFTTFGLPLGLSLSESGLISGTPTEVGNFTFSITATDNTGATLTQFHNLTVTEAVPVVPNSATSVQAGQTVTIDLAQGATGGSFLGTSIDSFTGGTIVFTGNTTIVFTPTSGYVGVAKVSYYLRNAIGLSSMATVNITVNGVTPTANNLSGTVDAGKSVVVDLTQGATGGPFLPGLPVLPVSPSNAGTAIVSADNKMTFTAAANFTGTATIAYMLVNSGGVSSPSSVTITVNGVTQANPTQNATVMGIVSAQTRSVQQFASAQLSNFSQRLETLHGNGFGSSSFGLSFNQQLTPSEALAKDSASWQPKYDGDTVVKNAWQSGIQRVSWPAKSANTDSSVTSTLPDLPNQSGVKQRALAFWISGVVDYGKQSANEQHGSYKLSTTGVSLGVDYRLTDWLTIGTGLGYASSRADIGDNGSTNKSQSTMLMLYGSLRPYQHLYIDSIIGTGSLDFDMKRFDDGSNDFAHGSRGGNLAFGSVAVGWDFIHESWLWSPYTRFDYSRATLDAYAETGVGNNALHYYNQTVHNSKMNYGIRTEGKIETRFGEWHPTARIEYANQLSGSGQTRISYADQLGTGPVYAVDNSNVSFGNWTVGLGSKLILRNHMEVIVDYSHNVNVSMGQYQSLRLTLRIPM